MDINRIITESISALINDDRSDVVNEGIKEAADTAKEASGKVTGFVKSAVKEGKEFIGENPKTSAAMAAALAAGLGAVAFRKKLAVLAKKGLPGAKKKTAEVAKKIAKKLES